jgi:leucyl aminopeptidase (aminopeptidase T)
LRHYFRKEKIMLELLKGARLLVETCAKVGRGERMLVVVDDEAFPMLMGKAVFDVANSVGAEAVLTIMKLREGAAIEPPRAIAIAMKSVNVVAYITNRHGMAHTDARKEAAAAGVRIYQMTAVPEDYFKREITAADIEKIKDCTEALAERLTCASLAHVTTPAGTDITMSLDGRKGIGIHPLSAVIGTFPDYAEAAIAPVEGTTEGTLVIDVGILGWEYLLMQPIICKIVGGKVMTISGGKDAEKLRSKANTDEHSSNIAELGIGTSHTVPRVNRATRRDAAIAGNVHIAIGRNNDIGGKTWSKIHIDGLINRATVKLDGKYVVRDGVLL